ncbi:hypothetical protein N0A02_25170 [Paraburkholderia acidicola]|uniref:Uncharacterized protein n=1 Tax=Paraburkholderia acidicola TaxID=1912599 RepID=A0ABV1LTZ2_9BURK
MQIKTIQIACSIGIVSIAIAIYLTGALSASHNLRWSKQNENRWATQIADKFQPAHTSNKSGYLRVSTSPDSNSTQLIGPDSNKNAVRDDIDEYIDKMYPEPRQHAAMIQFATAYGALLLNGGTVDGARKATSEVVRAVQCGIEVFGDSNVAKQKTILAMMLDSKERFTAYAVATHNEEGQVFPRFEGEPCL